jgi:hypothetical protein
MDKHFYLMRSITDSTPFGLNRYRPSPGLQRLPSSASTSLLDLMMRFSRSECQDAKDKAFGLLGLKTAYCRDSMMADYPKSLPEVCDAALVHYLHEHVVWNEDCWTFCKAMPVVLGMIGINMRDSIADVREFTKPDVFAPYDQFGELGPVTWLSTSHYYSPSARKFGSLTVESSNPAFGLQSLRIFATGDKLFGCATSGIRIGDNPRYREGRERHGILGFFQEVDGKQEKTGQGFRLGSDYMSFDERLRQSSSACAVSEMFLGPNGSAHEHC